MKQLLHYQIEQRCIIDSIKFNISKNLELSSIFQTTIERVRNFLEVDRLFVYRLNTEAESFETYNQNIFKENRVIYEAKSSTDISSIFNIRHPNYDFYLKKCWAKYRQGFTFAINDIEEANLTGESERLMNLLNVKAKLVVPINLREKLWGLLIAHQCDHTRVWHYNETRFLRQIAEYLAIAVYRHQSYDELQTQKKFLEKQVRSQAQQIKDALIAAKVASQSKHKFIGTVSHELRTPLTKVIGLSGTLLHWTSQEGSSSLPIKKQQQYLKTIQESGKHLLKLINNIIEFSEVESGKHLLDYRPINLQDFCQTIIQSLQTTADDLDLELALDFQLAADFSHFDGDPVRIQEIILNLLDNALKFTPAGGAICLKVWQEQKQLIFEIDDTGIGISEQKIPLLFEAFEPIENFRQRVYDGAGLGLALTKHLVELHGGNIEVESTLGKGSTFRVYLPVVKETAISKSNLDNAEKEIVKPPKKVVLISQDEGIALTICQLLNAFNYQVVWLIDAITAISQIDFLEPQIVILDRDNLRIEIPDVTDAIKAIETIEATKIILLYSQMKSETWNFLRENGVDARLDKAENLSLLLEKIEALET